ncbi:MAG TPA: IS66 family insertion sequence element accessory protein TnpB [Paludibacteraceae bacterium]|nr:IS66 family insertion sequence element accessory protein TnpB [Paludibacteraceae bacterium]
MNGDVYVFLNKSRTTMKLLHWERGGFVIYYKRMDQLSLNPCGSIFLPNVLWLRP